MSERRKTKAQLVEELASLRQRLAECETAAGGDWHLGSEGRLRLLIDSLPVPMCYVGSDQRYRLNNEAYRQWFGLGYEETEGRHIRDVLGDDVYRRVQPHVDAALSGRHTSYENVVRHRDGSTRTISVTYAPDMSEHGDVRGFFALAADITGLKAAWKECHGARDELETRVQKRTADLERLNEDLRAEIAKRKLVEASLRRSQQDYLTLFESVIDGMVVVDAETMRIVLANDRAAEMCGFDCVEDLYSIDLLERIHPEDRERALTSITGGVPGEDLRRLDQFRAYTRDEREKWIEAVGVKIEHRGRPAVLASFRDITARKLAEEEQRMHVREMEFVSSVATELLGLPLEADIYQYIARRLGDLAGGETTVLVSSCDGEAPSFRVRAVSAPDGHVAAMVSVLGGVPIGLSTPVSDGARKGLSTSVLEKVPGGIYELAAGALPKRVCRDVEEALGVREIVAIGLSWEGEVHGSATLLSGQPISVSSQRTIEAFIRLASVALQRRLAAEALHHSETRYRLLAENAADVIWTTDLELKPTYISPSVQRQRGCTVEEAMARPLEEKFRPTSLARVRQVADDIAQAAAGSAIPFHRATLDLEMVRKDGSTIWTEVTLKLLTDANGRPTGLLGVTRDISARRAAEQALRRSERLYRTAIESARDGILITDTEERIVDANPTLVASLGYSDREQLIGREAGEVLAPSTLKELGSGLKDSLRQLLREGKGYVINLQLMARTVAGTEVPVEMNISRLVDEEGQLTGFLHVIRDITEHKRTEETIGRYAGHLEALHAISAAVSQTLDLDEMLANALETAIRVTGVDGGYVHLFDRDRRRLVLRKHRGISAARVKRLQALDVTDEAIRRWEEHPEPAFRVERILSSDAYGVARSSGEHEGVSRQSYLAIPLFAKSQMYGGLSLVCRSPRRYSGDELELLRAIGNEIAVGIDNARLYEEARAAARAMQAERDRAETYLDIADVITVVVDAAGKVELMNRKGCQLLGYEESEIVGRDWFDTFLPEEVRQQVREYHRAFFAGEIEAPASNENPVLTRQGERRDILWRNSVLRDAEGKVVASVSSGEDITERKRAEEALQASEEKYRNLVDGLLDGYLVVRGSRILFANRVIADHLRLSPDELTGPSFLGLLTPESRETARAIYDSTRRGEAPPHLVEVEFVRQDGTTAPVELRISEMAYEGQRAYSVLVRDVAERRKAEEALRESEEKLRLMFESMTEGMTVSDLEGNMTSVNEAGARMFGTGDRAEIIGRSALDFVSPADRDRVGESMARTLRQGSVGTIECRLLRMDGTEYDAEVDAAALTDSTGQATGFIAVLRDVTERKQAEERLRAFQRRLRSLASRLSQAEDQERKQLATGLHDRIGQPLAVIKIKLGVLHEPLQQVGLDT
ncbi:MAG: PAS domain S-box protein, partial [Chloroflexota bacterium]|nr:PAS domain S-box protein [Chloroflexota bacterium]